MAETRDEDQLPLFGAEAHRVLARARAAAHRLRHATLGTEHLLIGCVEEPRGQAAELLHRAGISPDDVVDRVRLLNKRMDESPSHELLMAPGLRMALRMAREEAEQLRDGEVRSEHLLLAILREHSSGGAVVLRATGLDPRLLRTAALRHRLAAPARKARAPWIASGPYRVLALLGAFSTTGAAAFALGWLVTVRPFVRSAYLYELVIPLSLLSIGMVSIGASRMEAIRQASARESLLAFWATRGAAAQVTAALSLAQAGAMAQATPLLEAAVDRGMPDEESRAALTALARWLADEQLAPYGYFARGVLRAHAGQMQSAVADLETAVRRRPDDAHWHDVYGLWLARAGRDDAAYLLLRTAVERQSPDSRAVLACATLLLRRGEPREAQALAQYAVKLLPSTPQPLALLAAAQSLLGATTEAAATLRQALLLDPYHQLARALQAVGMLLEGGAAEALSILRDASEATVDRPGYVAAIEGWALTVLGSEQEARLAFAQAQEREPGLVKMLTRMEQGLREGHHDLAAREVSTLLARFAQ